MEQLYHKTSFRISKLVTEDYSTSFSLGIRVFAPEFRNAIYAIYGYVRLADEIVDSFQNYDRNAMLAAFRAETFNAITSGISSNPVINAFQLIVNEYKIDKSYIEDFLNSMENDLYNDYYERYEFNKYIYGSAEVVGLMCLKVFCGADTRLFESLIKPAKALGSAFQKVNFLRDINSDIVERGRIYLPGISNKAEIDNQAKAALEAEIEAEFKIALEGIMRLPSGVKLGVYSAYLYYYILLKKIRNLTVHDLMKKRIRISNYSKIALLFKSIIEVKVLRIE